MNDLTQTTPPSPQKTKFQKSSTDSKTPTLTSSIQYLKGVGPKLAKVLSKKGLQTIEDALYNLPRTYEDRRSITPIRNLKPNQPATLLGKVTHSRQMGHRRPKRFEVTLSDGTGEIKLMWFRAYPSLSAEFSKNSQFVVYGEVKYYGGILQIVHPDYEKITQTQDGKPVTTFHFGRIVPVYSETEGLYQKNHKACHGRSFKDVTSPIRRLPTRKDARQIGSSQPSKKLY